MSGVWITVTSHPQQTEICSGTIEPSEMCEVISELYSMIGQSKDEGRHILVKHTNKHKLPLPFLTTSTMSTQNSFFNKSVQQNG